MVCLQLSDTCHQDATEPEQAFAFAAETCDLTLDQASQGFRELERLALRTIDGSSGGSAMAAATARQCGDGIATWVRTRIKYAVFLPLSTLTWSAREN